MKYASNASIQLKKGLDVSFTNAVVLAGGEQRKKVNALKGIGD